MNQPGRNDPCPCGSGLKFKKCCLKENRPDQADSEDVAGLRALAFKEMSLENWDEAIDKFKACLDTVPDPHTVLEAIGACYDGLEEYLFAAEHYEKALASCPKNRRFDVSYRLGVARGCAERIEKAREAFGACLEAEPEGAKKNAVLRALEMVDEILQGKRNPSLFRVQVQLQRAFSDMEAERYESAAARLENLSRIEPENPAIFYNLGVVYSLMKKEDEATRHFKRCLDLNPAYVQAWYNMGQISLISKRDFSFALHCFDQAVAIRPDYIGAHHQRGVAWEMLGDPEKAVACWEKTLELDPENKMAKDNIERLKSTHAFEAGQ